MQRVDRYTSCHSLQLLVLGSVLGIGDDGLGNLGSVDNGLSNLAGNLLGG